MRRPIADPLAVRRRTSGDVTPEDIVAQIEKHFGYAKSAWPLGVIRQLADALLEVA